MKPIASMLSSASSSAAASSAGALGVSSSFLEEAKATAPPGDRDDDDEAPEASRRGASGRRLCAGKSRGEGGGEVSPSSSFLASFLAAEPLPLPGPLEALKCPLPRAAREAPPDLPRPPFPEALPPPPPLPMGRHSSAPRPLLSAYTTKSTAIPDSSVQAPMTSVACTNRSPLCLLAPGWSMGTCGLTQPKPPHHLMTSPERRSPAAMRSREPWMTLGGPLGKRRPGSVLTAGLDLSWSLRQAPQAGATTVSFPAIFSTVKRPGPPPSMTWNWSGRLNRNLM
mmetsp:Transcript_38896/g.124793  ORF Transcript_38896/g.124793 Transcript_38896/m.124793 type:complete len:282 (-) Transcript_38896:357-1202(-)